MNERVRVCTVMVSNIIENTFFEETFLKYIKFYIIHIRSVLMATVGPVLISENKKYFIEAVLWIYGVILKSNELYFSASEIHIRPWHWTVATTGPGGQWIQWIRKSTGPPKNPLAPQKHIMTQMFSRREFMIARVKLHIFFCTLGLYITKNKYELTLSSEFCRLPVKIMAAYEALKKLNKKTLAPWASGK